MFSLTDGVLRFLSVENNEVSSSKMHADISCPLVTAVAWRDSVLVAGDSNGGVTVYNTDNRKSQ